MITGKNIHKRYGKVEVLKGVDVEINKGEVVSIVGPSGSGKSTLLHILGTLDKADTGEVSMNNTIINSLSGKKLAAFRNKHIGFVFQFHHLLPEFTAVENICLLYTSDAADERSSVDLGGPRIFKKKNERNK